MTRASEMSIQTMLMVSSTDGPNEAVAMALLWKKAMEQMVNF